MIAGAAPTSALRVALYGNMCNFLYQIAKSLRNPQDPAVAIDAHLYVERTADLQNLPESDDPELSAGYPDWIHVGDWLHGRWRALGIALPAALPVVREWRGYDMLVVSAEGPSAARFCGRPYVFLTGGGDLTLMPFADRYAALNPGAGALKMLAWRLRAHWQRLGILAASAVLTQPFRPFLDALGQLGVAQERIAGTTSLLTLDTDRFRRGADGAQRRGGEGVPEALRDCDFLLFHPSRMMIRDDSVLRETGQWKANDALLRGFAEFVRTGIARRPRIALIARSHSLDIALAKTEIERLGIGEQVVWLQGPTAEGFSRHELFSWYGISDVVADDFGAGWFGSIALEGCAAECPVLTYVDEEAMRKMYPWHPFVNARTPSEIAERLAELFQDADARRRIGQRGREWVDEFHSPRRHGEHFRAELLKLMPG